MTGFRPSFRALRDNILGDVWHHTSSAPPQAPPPPRSSPLSPIHTHFCLDSLASPYTQVQLYPAAPQIYLPRTPSPTLALARQPFAPRPGPAHTRASKSVDHIDAANSWPSPRGIEYVRATVTPTIAPVPRKVVRPNRRSLPPSATDGSRTKGLQPLLLESKARPSSIIKRKTPMVLDKEKRSRTPPETAKGLRPLSLACKARPARSAEERARATIQFPTGDDRPQLSERDRRLTCP